MADNYFGLFNGLQSTKITINQNRCVSVRNRNASCSKCAEACTSGAISLLRGKPTVADELCTGCGTCATACPTCALEAQNPNDAELFESCLHAMQNAGGKSVIVCDGVLLERGETDGLAQIAHVSCLGRVDESLIVLLARAQAQRVTLLKGTCEACRHKPGSAMAEQVCNNANLLLKAWERIPLVNLQESANFNWSERTSPTYGGDGEGDLGELDERIDTSLEKMPIRPENLSFQKVKADRTLPHYLPHRRNRLLRALQDMNPHPSNKPIETRLWGRAEIDPASCISCRMCATFCPTEAIRKFDEEDGKMGIVHYASRCVKCHCCENICPAHAITIRDDVCIRELEARTGTPFAMDPDRNPLGPHQMRDATRDLLKDSSIFDR